MHIDSVGSRERCWQIIFSHEKCARPSLRERLKSRKQRRQRDQALPLSSLGAVRSHQALPPGTAILSVPRAIQLYGAGPRAPAPGHRLQGHRLQGGRLQWAGYRGRIHGARCSGARSARHTDPKTGGGRAAKSELSREAILVSLSLDQVFAAGEPALCQARLELAETRGRGEERRSRRAGWRRASQSASHL